MTGTSLTRRNDTATPLWSSRPLGMREAFDVWLAHDGTVDGVVLPGLMKHGDKSIEDRCQWSTVRLALASCTGRGPKTYALAWAARYLNSDQRGAVKRLWAVHATWQPEGVL